MNDLNNSYTGVQNPIFNLMSQLGNQNQYPNLMMQNQLGLFMPGFFPQSLIFGGNNQGENQLPAPLPVDQSEFLFMCPPNLNLIPDQLGISLKNQYLGQQPMVFGGNNQIENSLLLSHIHPIDLSVDTFPAPIPILENKEKNVNIPASKTVKEINVKFRGNQNSPLIIVKCQPDEKVFSMINKYRVKSNDYEQKIRFIYNCKTLNMNSTLVKEGIYDNCEVLVLCTKNIF